MKNKMMRAASVLMVAVLLSTCAISGTFAKYVTSVTSGDSARVAKWNIGHNFDEKSTFAATYNSGKVESLGGADKVVAPGTADSGTYELSGAPEVAYKVTFNFDKQAEVFLKQGNYDFADAAYVNMDLNLGTDYIPLKWTVALTTGAGATISQIDPLGVAALGASNTFNTMAEIEAAFANTQIDYAANKEAGITIVIGWTWAISQNDQADTILGYLGNDVTATNAMLAGADLVADTDFCTNVAYDLTITATQVD